MHARGLVLIAAVFAGCQGDILYGSRTGGPGAPPAGSGAGTGGSGAGAGGGTTDPNAVAGPRFACTQPQAQGTTFPTLRRLTRTELINTWSALVGPTVAADATVSGGLLGLPADDLQSLSTVTDEVPTVWASTLSTVAARSATLLLANTSERSRLLGACSTQTPLTDACVQSVIAAWGARAWRRDLEASEIAGLLSYYQAAGSGEAGLGYLVRRVLQAPTLAFHLETRGTTSGERVQLTPFEVASRVAFLTTASMPDDALLGAARTGQLTTSAQVRAHVLRLLDTPLGRARVRDLFRYYMKLGQVAEPYAPLAALRGLGTTGLGDELRTEALDFGQQVFFDAADGSFTQLMTSPLTTPKSERVAKIFGLTCPSAPATSSFAWDDASTFFAADGSGPGPTQAQLTTSGWFVWQLPAGRVGAAATQLKIEVVATAADAVPLQLDVNLNDVPLVTGFSAAPGTSTITATVAIASGAATKVGVYYRNAAAGRSLQVRSLSLVGATSTSSCSGAPMTASSHLGLLHRPALLVGAAARTSPILRGAHVRKLFLCTDLSTPDPAVVAARQTEVGDLDAVPNRERVTTLTSAPFCAGCHTQVNPLGFPFENFDQAGMVRASEQRFDVSGQPTITMPLDLRVDRPLLDSVGGPSTLADSVDLVRGMAQSARAKACFTQRAFEYFRRAALDPVKDGCALASAEAKASSGTLRDVVADLLSADDVFFRVTP